MPVVAHDHGGLEMNVPVRGDQLASSPPIRRSLPHSYRDALFDNSESVEARLEAILARKDASMRRMLAQSQDPMAHLVSRRVESSV